MSQTYTYSFKQGTQTDTINVTVSTTLQTITSKVSGETATGQGYAVTAISGNIGGNTISGVTGNKGVVSSTSNGVAVYDNALFPVASSGVVAGSGVSGSQYGIDYAGLLFKVGNTTYNLFEQNGTFQLLTVSGTTNPTTTLTLLSTTAPCFCAGTSISTPNGTRLVEELAIGDTVLTPSGEVKTVRWMGRRVVDMKFADPLRALPVRIKAGALGNGLPVRDLLVSPYHAMFLDGILVQAGAMVNGSSIVREGNMPAQFTYYHIETADHALILAEGSPTETFVDNVDRMAFDNWAEYQAIAGDAEPIAEMDYPRAKSARQVPASLRAKLAALAAPYAALQAA